MTSAAVMVLVAFAAGWLFAKWDERHALTWRGRFDWFFALRCRWFGIHEPDPSGWTDCVHCRYAGPLVQEQERRRDEVLAELRGAAFPTDWPTP